MRTPGHSGITETSPVPEFDMFPFASAVASVLAGPARQHVDLVPPIHESGDHTADVEADAPAGGVGWVLGGDEQDLHGAAAGNTTQPGSVSDGASPLS